MAEDVLQVLVEGYDPEEAARVENKYDEYWKEVYGAFQNRTILQAMVTGVEIDPESKVPTAILSVGGLRGLIPLGSSGVEDERQLHKLTGQRVAFKVIHCDREENVFIASRAEALEHMSSVTWQKIKEGQVVMAVVRSVSFMKVRVDIGGIEVNIPIDEMAYGWIDDLREFVKPGDHVKVKVLQVDEENRVIKVSAKAAAENPWPECANRYGVGNEYMGVVSGIREYGVFVTLEQGVDCLSRHLKFENVAKDDKVVVRILDTDIEKEQIRSRIVRIL